MTVADIANTAEDATDELAALCADLLAEVRYEPFMTRLLNMPIGQWHLLSNLVVGLDDIRASVASLDQTLSCPTWTAWMEHPGCAEGPGYITVSFFNEGGMSRVWIYNRARAVPGLPSSSRSG